MSRKCLYQEATKTSGRKKELEAESHKKNRVQKPKKEPGAKAEKRTGADGAPWGGPYGPPWGDPRPFREEDLICY